MNSLQYYDLASLAEASYVLLNQVEYQDEEEFKKNLQNERINSKMSATQAKMFVEKWEVSAHQANTDSGFSATLFHGKDGSYVYACRGTEQIWTDLAITDVMDIVTDGLAINQIVDMYNDWMRIISNGEYKAAKLVDVDSVVTRLSGN